MEAFHYNGHRIFDPHNTVEELSIPQIIKRQTVFAINKVIWKIWSKNE